MKFFTLVLGVSVAIVAWLQWWVALNKLRLDLFDRRWQIYTATSNAEFLFGSDVVKGRNSSVLIP